MNRSKLLFVLFTFVLTFFVISVEANSSVRRIVIFNDEVTMSEQIDVGNKYGLSVLNDLELINGKSVMIPSKAVKNLMDDKRIKMIVNDDIVSILGKPGSSQFTEFIPWGVDTIEADQAWVSSTGVGVKVGIIDTGIDIDHIDLAQNIKGGINIISTRKSFDDDNGHGTHVAGTIGAVDNEIGVIGIAPNVDLYGIKVLDRRGSGYTSDIIAGIEWAVSQGLDVVNMSLGSAYYNAAFAQAVNEAYQAGLIIVAAAGNESTSVGYPAAYPEVIAVSAIDKNYDFAYFSNFGPEIDVAAPGVAIESTYIDDQYVYMDGTSMSSPHVTGAIALMLEDNSGLTLEQVRTKFSTTSVDLGVNGFDNYYGYGLIDASALVR